MTINLDTLRKTAEAATPGPWTLEYENSDDWESGINDGDYPYTIHGPRNCSFDNWEDKSMVQDSLNRVTEISEMVDADAEFIATFDPPTVLALLSRLEQAEQAVQRVRAKHAERVLVYPNGAEEHYCSAEENSAWPCDTIRALDGNGRG